MPRTGENIYKRKDGRWEGRYIIGHTGRKIRYGYVYSRTYAETRSKLHDAMNRKNIAADRYITKENFGSYASEWLNSVRLQLKESTAASYENILSAYIRPYFDDVSIGNITNEDISRFANELLSCGGRSREGLSAKTVSSVLSVMKGIFTFAEAKGAFVSAGTESVTLRQSRKIMRVFSQAEQEKLNGYLYENLSLSNLGILLCLYTGLRIGELCALRWGDISVSDKTLKVNKTMLRIKCRDGDTKTKVIITPPKSECSVRTIPIPDGIAEVLGRFDFDGDTYFLTGRNDIFAEPRTMQYRFKTVLKKCGIESANFHALRHTFATRCVELGFDIKSLSEILGHAGVNITLSRYVHPSMELKKKNMDRLSGLLTVR